MAGAREEAEARQPVWKLIAAWVRCLLEMVNRLGLSLWVLLHGRELGGDRPHLLEE